jgi:phosphate transport system protein
MDESAQLGSRQTTLEPRPLAAGHTSQSLRDQDALWADFLAMALGVVHSLSKSVAVLCENRLDILPEVKMLERDSDRAEVRIEKACLRVLARFEPVASDLRRMATILKVTRDWERIADLAMRVARRAGKLAKSPDNVPVPDALKALARDVLRLVQSAYEAQATRDAVSARQVIAGDGEIDRQYRALQLSLKESLRRAPTQLESWLKCMSTARNLERIADHATGIAQTIIYLREGIIVRHTRDDSADE